MSAGDVAAGALIEQLAGRIRRDGPLPVSRYVEAALYDPDHGFYNTGGRAGRDGDFITAPEVGPLFGAVLARAIDRWWHDLGRPSSLAVIDWGAGPGTLARSVLAAAPEVLAEDALVWISVESSARQRTRHIDHPAVRSVAGMADRAELADLVARRRRRESTSGCHRDSHRDAIATIVVANELLDNLPFDVYERTAGGWVEVRIGLEGSDRLVAVMVPTSTERVVPGEVEVGRRVPVPVAARRWLAETRRLVHRGRIVVLDYGATTTELAARPDHGWLRVHRGHGRGDLGRDDRRWLDDPGSRDITADVAFDQLQLDHAAARTATQAAFLREHGIDELVRDGRRIWADRAHVGDLEALRARSRVSEAEALLDPDGMGAFTVMEWEVGEADLAG